MPNAIGTRNSSTRRTRIDGSAMRRPGKADRPFLQQLVHRRRIPHLRVSPRVVLFDLEEGH